MARPPVDGVRRAMALLLLLPSLLWSIAARAEDAGLDAEARYAREQLLGEARRSVNPQDPGGWDLRAFREALEADRAALASMGTTASDLRRMLEETIETRTRLLGRGEPAAAEGVKERPEGALGQARWLHRWLLGLETCDVIIRDVGSAGPPTKSFPWPTAASPAAEGAAAPPPDLDAWAQGVKAQVGGSLLRCRIEAGVCATLDDLVALAAVPPTYLPFASLEVPQRHAIAGPASAAFEVNEPILRLRALQSAERVAAYGMEVPDGGLVDEPTVRDKARRATELRDEAARVKSRRDQVVDDLNRMALGSADAWRQVLGALGAQIEEAKRANAAPEGGAAKEPLSAVQVRLLEAQESTALLDLRLLHLTALRSDLRRRLLDRWVALVEAEALAAEGAHARHADALSGLRRERQMVRLEFERDRKIRRDLQRTEDLLAQGTTDAADAARLEGLRARRALIESLLDVNAVVLDAVRLRRLAHGRLQAKAVATEPERAAPPAGVAKAVDVAAGPGDPLGGLRAPETSPLDDAYVATALQRLQDPGLGEVFDAALVARHHEAVDRRLVALREALADTARLDGLEGRFQGVVATARERLTALRAHASQRAWVHRYGDTLATHEADFAETISVLRTDRERMGQRVETLWAYRRTLRDLGARSFRIRGRRGITAEGLARAGDDVRWAAEEAVAWVALRRDPHLLDFVGARWPGLLALVALALGGAFGLRWGRRALDRRIDTRVAAIPGLRGTGASPGEERQQAQANVEMREAAAKAAEATVLRQAAGDESAAPTEPTAETPGAAPALPAPPAADSETRTP